MRSLRSRGLLASLLPLLALGLMPGADIPGPLARFDTLSILTAAGLDLCEHGRLFAIDSPDADRAITVLLSDRSLPVDRLRDQGKPFGSATEAAAFWRGRDFRGWEMLRYAANNLRGCKPCLVRDGHPVTWPDPGNLGPLDAFEYMERITLRAVSNLRDWLAAPPPEVLRALAELERVGPGVFDAARFYAEDAHRQETPRDSSL